MIKAQTNKGDLILGLQKENIERLRKGEPIAFDFGTIYPELEGKKCIILFGETQGDIMKYFDVGPNTKIKT